MARVALVTGGASAAVSGISRYARELCNAFQGCDDVDRSLLPLGMRVWGSNWVRERLGVDHRNRRTHLG